MGRGAETHLAKVELDLEGELRRLGSVGCEEGWKLGDASWEIGASSLRGGWSDLPAEWTGWNNLGPVVYRTAGIEIRTEAS